MLTGSLVRLEPVSRRHHADLAVAVEEDRGSYTHIRVPRSSGIEQYLDLVLERERSNKIAPFTQVRLADGRAVGGVAYCTPRYWPGDTRLFAVEIGWIWLAASAQGTGIAVESQLLLLEYAFETLEIVRVDFLTDVRNIRAQRVLTRIGAQFEGVLRHWSPSRSPGEDGAPQDDMMFSILASEWPNTKAGLHHQLAAPRHRRTTE